MRADCRNAPFVKKDRIQGFLATEHSLGEGKGEASWQGEFQPRSCDQAFTRTALRKGKLFSSPIDSQTKGGTPSAPKLRTAWAGAGGQHHPQLTLPLTAARETKAQSWPSPPNTSLTARRSNRRGTQSSDEEAGACSEHNGNKPASCVALQCFGNSVPVPQQEFYTGCQVLLQTTPLSPQLTCGTKRGAGSITTRWAQGREAADASSMRMLTEPNGALGKLQEQWLESSRAPCRHNDWEPRADLIKSRRAGIVPGSSLMRRVPTPPSC